MLSKSELRQSLRKRRKALSRHDQKIAAIRLARQLKRLPTFRHARYIAAYWPNDGEISPLPFLAELLRQGKVLYLPRILNNGHLEFHRFHPDIRMNNNTYSIPEPVGGQCRHAQNLDIVLMPLVGFDRRRNRLGMGGGYYDKTFAFHRKSLWKNRPRLIGLAHHFQQVDNLHHDNWDIPLNMIVTDKGYI